MEEALSVSSVAAKDTEGGISGSLPGSSQESVQESKRVAEKIRVRFVLGAGLVFPGVCVLVQLVK